MACHLMVRDDFLLIRNPTVHNALSAWEITVAYAAPLTPIPSAKIKMGSSMILEAAPKSTAIMAVLDCPWEIMNALSPSASSTKIVPAR